MANQIPPAVREIDSSAIVFTLESDQFRQDPTEEDEQVREIVGLPQWIIDEIRKDWGNGMLLQDTLYRIRELIEPYMDTITVTLENATTIPLSEFMEEVMALRES